MTARPPLSSFAEADEREERRLKDEQPHHKVNQDHEEKCVDYVKDAIVQA